MPPFWSASPPKNLCFNGSSFSAIIWRGLLWHDFCFPQTFSGCIRLWDCSSQQPNDLKPQINPGAVNIDEGGPWESACSGLPQQMALTLCPDLYFAGGVRVRIVLYSGFTFVHDLNRLHRVLGESWNSLKQIYYSLVNYFNMMNVNFQYCSPNSYWMRWDLMSYVLGSCFCAFS